jgi:hypothetical protein
MEIIGRNPNPDKYSISEVRVAFGDTAEEVRREGKKKERRTVISTLRLFVYLEPEGYLRERGFGNSYETKDNACTLQIEGNELEQIQEALRQELKHAYQFLYDKGLLAAYERHKEQQESPPSEADLPDKNLAHSARS